MAYNGSGTFNRVYDWTTDAAAGTKISASRMDTELDGIATGLSNAIAKDGQTTITANIPLATYKITGLGDATLAGDAVNAGQVADGGLVYAADTTNTDAYEINPTPAIAAYASGQIFRFKLTNANTGAVTVDISGLGAKAVKLRGAALAGGELAAGSIHTIGYNGTDFDLLSVSHVDLTAADYQDNTVTYATAGGTADVLTLTLSPAPAAYAAGQVFAFKAASTNTGAATINVNSLGAKNIYRDGAALSAGDITSGRVYLAAYNGTEFDLITPGSASSLAGVTSSSTTVLGYGAKTGSTGGAILIGSSAGASLTATALTDIIAIGDNVLPSVTDPGTNNIIIGADAGASLGTGDSATVIIGDSADSSVSNAVAIGGSASVTASGGVAVGQGASAAGTDAIAIGRGASAAHANAICLGQGATSGGTGEFVLSNMATAGTAGSLSTYWTVSINGTDYKIPLYATA